MSAATAAAVPSQMLDIDDLVASLSTSHIGQHHRDIQNIRDQLAQLLYAQPQPKLAALNYAAAETRKRSVSVVSNLSMDAEMDLDEQQQPQHHWLPTAPAGSPQRMLYEQHYQSQWPAQTAAHQPSHIFVHASAAVPTEPAPPPASPTQTGSFFSESQYARSTRMEVSAPF